MRVLRDDLRLCVVWVALACVSVFVPSFVRSSIAVRHRHNRYEALKEEQLARLSTPEAAAAEAAAIEEEERQKAEAERVAAAEAARIAEEKAAAAAAAVAAAEDGSEAASHGEGSAGAAEGGGDIDEDNDNDNDDGGGGGGAEPAVAQAPPVELPHAIPVGHSVDYTLTDDEFAEALGAATAAYDAQHGTPEEREEALAASDAASTDLETLRSNLADAQAQAEAEGGEGAAAAAGSGGSGDAATMAELTQAVASAAARAKSAAAAAQFPAFEEPPRVVRAMVHAHEVPSQEQEEEGDGGKGLSLIHI